MRVDELQEHVLHLTESESDLRKQLDSQKRINAKLSGKLQKSRELFRRAADSRNRKRKIVARMQLKIEEIKSQLIAEEEKNERLLGRKRRLRKL